MIDSTAACDRGRVQIKLGKDAGSSACLLQAETRGRRPAQIWRVIRVRGVVESTIYRWSGGSARSALSLPNGRAVRASARRSARRSLRRGSVAPLPP
jgi:transposase-like protein